MVDVRVTSGALSGTWKSGVAVFRGIPYAAAPVGANRFAAPQPAKSWDGVRPAVSFGPPPPQSDALGRGPSGVSGDDWLTVNVWSPAPGPAAKLPVLVWIYGGAYTLGSAAWPEYDGGHLARAGVVLVTLNYRLGIEGFAHLAGAPANRGLLDQVAALEWVHENIAAFGGDPGRVTIFGESAGGGAVAALLAMPRATGLFRGAVAQSMPGTFLTPELAADIAEACAAELDLPPTADALATIDPARLAAAGDAVTATAPARTDRWGPAASRSILFAPIVDGDTLPTTPWQALASGAARDVTLLAGHTRDEHRLFTAMFGPATPDQTETALRLLAPTPDSYREFDPAQRHELVQSDWLFRMPTLHLADAQLAGGGRAYFYELTWPAPGLGGILGACHGLDVPLVFGNLTSGGPAALLGETPGPEAIELSARMRSAWTAFATNGDPGWPAYRPDEFLTQILDVPGAVTPYPEQPSRKIWQNHKFAPLTLRP
ncbi:carboxylesterase/lipase family protein [Paractinoplanes toevensis]|uniref:Carboxylic ester hydrolase n=1 Tax=Paractinoplanes toevensis TaxID=571911 RepID=A0A919W793_9ACTN|nr:carboxylesterase family protein [Actinoplanes toevensis]GIM88596.1 carboxylic ester hydrolase [Actinoplanes toevensis]